MLKNTLVSLLLLMAGCASMENASRISTTLKVYEYNSVASNYMPRPTFTELGTVDGVKVLHITSDEYGKIGNDPQKTSHIYLKQTYVDDYISLIDKFLEWEKLASERGDTLEKNIGEAKDNLVFDFYSGNSKSHYLVISLKASGVILWENYFPKTEVSNLRNLLIQFKNNQIKTTDSSVYQ